MNMPKNRQKGLPATLQGKDRDRGPAAWRGRGQFEHQDICLFSLCLCLCPLCLPLFLHSSLSHLQQETIASE